jgi:hypothetical protein
MNAPLVLEYCERRHLGSGHRTVWALCSCGVVFVVRLGYLGNGHTLSCGCYQRKRNSETHFKHGHDRPGQETSTHRSWRALVQRCTNKGNNRYYRYGGRGISVSPLWVKDFQRFLTDVGECPGKGYSIDRINNDGNYEPGNVRWATAKQQANNH